MAVLDPSAQPRAQGLESVHTGVVCAVDRPNRRGFIRVEELHELLGKDVLFRLAQLPGAEAGSDEERLG